MAITIRDIARECSVSTSTVSGVLHNRDYVKKETRDRILAAIKKLNYDPLVNIPLARNRRTGKIGLILPFSNSMNSPFYQRALNAVKDATSDRGLECVIYSQDDVTRKTGVTYHLGRRNFECDGLVVFCPLPPWKTWLSTLTAWDIPVVLVRRRTTLPGVIQLVNDDEAGLRLALEHLYTTGHTRIGLLGRHPGHPFLTAHEQTCRAFMDEKGLPWHPDLVGGIFDKGREAVIPWWENLVRKKLVPSACLCRDDQLTLRLVLQLARLGVRVPEDLAVIGFDDDYGDDGLPLRLSSVRIPVEEMVTMGVRMLGDRLEGIKTGGAVIDMPLELKIRESSMKTSVERTA